ncbi:hypothetical protein GCM10010363_71630 [Streptomyces omiyaensis]|nr:hypothetical protein GCM10010363_71630 [Streptomyces omiyaensis]
MKPKPFSALNHFTVPLAILRVLLFRPAFRPGEKKEASPLREDVRCPSYPVRAPINRSCGHACEAVPEPRAGGRDRPGHEAEPGRHRSPRERKRSGGTGPALGPVVPTSARHDEGA